MHRVGLPKVALIPVSRPRKIDWIGKPIKITDGDFCRSRGVLVAYKNIDEILDKAREVDASFFYTVDEQRFLHFHNISDGEKRSFLENKLIRHTSDKESAERSSFYVYDINYDTYWSI